MIESVIGRWELTIYFLLISTTFRRHSDRYIHAGHQDLLSMSYFKLREISIKLNSVFQASLKTLPLNGLEWHEIRDGKLPELPSVSDQLLELLFKMISPIPEMRPSPATILKDRFLLSEEKEKICELTRKLNEERFENQRLLR